MAISSASSRCKLPYIQGIPGKGKVLTQISKFWFEKLASIIPNHFVTDKINEMPEEVRQYKDQLDGRAMLVKKATVVPLEAIVRGYLTGVYLNRCVALDTFKEASSHAHSRGLILADTKFEFGLVSSTDPSSPKQLILIDEVLTPDSSRYWPSEGYEAGKPQPSFDKQFLRDWLVGVGFRKGLEEGVDGEGWFIDEVIVTKTKKKYEEAVRMLTS
jgi:phosphoribosylaminoimidazole-succinocarboxamide synthase